MSQTIIMFITSSIGVFWGVIILMVILLLIAKKYLTPSGNVNITINGQKKLSVPQGASLLSTLAEQKVYLSSACGGKGSCGQCKCQVISGGGEAIDVEKSHFTRRELLDHYRLGCQVKVKGDMEITVPQSVLGVKKYECTVVSNNLSLIHI